MNRPRGFILRICLGAIALLYPLAGFDASLPAPAGAAGPGSGDQAAHAEAHTPQRDRKPLDAQFESLVGPRWPYRGPSPPAVSSAGMVATDASLATDVGVNVLRSGGNAADVAVATAFALAVVLPKAGNIGGGGFAVVRTAEGELAALDAAFQLGAIALEERNKAARPFRRRLFRERAVRPFLDRMFPPNPHFYRPARDDTIVCRCEEITAGQIRQAASEGGSGPNQVKAKLRCGMGACQGRMCGLTVSEIISQVHYLADGQAGYFHIRPPLKPLPLSALAEMED